MKTNRSRIVPLTIALFLAGFTASQALAQSADIGNLPVVTVNGDPITRNQFGVFISQNQKNLVGQDGKVSKQAQMAALNELVNYKLLEQQAITNKMDQMAAVRASLELNRSQVLANAAIQSYLAQHPVDEATLKARYKTKFEDVVRREFKTRHILLKSEEDAKAVIKELEGGANFAELAKKRSTDPSAKSGGELDWFGPGQLIPEIEATVQKLKSGKYNHTPVKSNFGWHVVLLEKTRPIANPPFEKVKGSLTQEIRQEQLNQMISELRKKADMKFPQAPKEAPLKK